MLHETKKDLLSDLRLPEDYSSSSLDQLLAGESGYLRDLRINLKNTLKSEHLSEKETALLALAIAANNGNEVLKKSFDTLCREMEATDAEIAEAIACTSLLRSNNVLYRFRHFTGKESYKNMPARIRMRIMARPVLGKEFFELMSLAVSAVNGCEACVNSHDHSVAQLGSSEERIFDAIRLASIVTSLGVIIH